MKLKMRFKLCLIYIWATFFAAYAHAASVGVTACKNALDQGDAKLALTQAQKAVSANKKDVEAHICQGRALLELENFDAALLAFMKADTLTTDPFDKTISNLLIGRTYAVLKKNDLAMLSFNQTLQNAKSAKNVGFERVAHHAMGDLYFDNQQYEQAVPEYALGIQLAANDNERGESNEKLALTYHKLNQNDRALEFQLKAFLMHSNAGTLDQYAHSSIELGHYYALIKNYSSAENTLNQIITFAQNQGGAFYEARASYVLAQVKVAKGELVAAQSLLAHAKEIALKIKANDLQTEIEAYENATFKDTAVLPR